MRQDRSALYATIWGNMSLESRDKVKETKGFDPNVNDDPLDLWLRIKETHAGGSSNFDTVKDQQRARENYASIRQYRNEAVARYKERFDHAIDQLRAVHETLPTPQAQSMDFISHLDPNRFSQLKAMLENNAILGIGTYPATLTEAFQLASNFKVAKSDGNQSSTLVPAHSAFIITKKKNNNYNKTETAAGSTTGNNFNKQTHHNKGKDYHNKSRSNNGKVASDSLGRKFDRKPKAGCAICGKEHYANMCPNLDRCKELLAEDEDNRKVASAMPLFNNNKPSHNNTGAVNLITLRVVHSITNDTRVYYLDEYDLLLDNQATVSIFKNKSMLSNLRTADDTLTITGVGGEITTNEIGNAGSFGEVYYSKKSPANILSFAGVRELGYDIQYDNDKGIFTVKINHTKSYVFKLRHGLFVCNVQHIFAAVVTVKDNEASYTKREVQAAAQAREIKRKLGYPSDKDLMDLVKTGIKDVPISYQDVIRANKIYGKNVAELKGKTRAKTPLSVKVEPIPQPLTAHQVLHVDLLFIEGLVFLISVSKPLSYLMVTQLPNRNTTSVQKALTEQINAYKSEKFTIGTILSDGEGAVSALTNYLYSLGIKINPAGPGQHVPVVENKIRQVKERVRAHIHGLPFNLSVSLLAWLVYFCSSRLNMMPDRTRVDSSSPREQFLGRKIDYKRDLRVGFADYCQVHTPNIIKNSMSARTEGAIALLPVGNLQGSVKFLSLTTLKVITRDYWNPLPMPEEVIQFLNNLALKQKRKLSKDPIFRLGSNTIIEDNDLDTTEEELIEDENVVNADNIIDVRDPLVRDHPGQEFMPADPQQTPQFMEQATTTDRQLSTDGVVTADSNNIDAINSNNSKIPTATMPNYRGDSAISSSSIEQYKNNEMNIRNQHALLPLPVTTEQSVDKITAISSNNNNLHDIGLDDINKNYQADGVVQQRASESNIIIPNEVNSNEAITTSSINSPLLNDETTTPRYNLRRTQARITRGFHTNYGFHISVKSALVKYNTKALKSIVKEIDQMHQKEVFSPVDSASLSQAQRKSIIRSHMFLKEKFLSTGEFDKLKARLVAGGDMQDKTLYENISSPTISLSSVFIITAIASFEKRIVVTADIAGAYLNAKMSTQEVLMRLDPFIASIVVKLKPDYGKFICTNGSMIVKLNRALYGCIQSAKLWNDHITNTLVKAGFKQNNLDTCVFNKEKDGIQVTVGIYVDDIMVTCSNQSMIDETLDLLKQTYQTVTVHEGKVHSYLGMTFDFSTEGKVKITMDGYIQELLKTYAITDTAATPATQHLFNIRDSPKLDTEKSEEFHSIVAKLLYLAKRVRPEILPATIFLTTRVNSATEDDWKKLMRILSYLNGSKHLGMVLTVNDEIKVFAYVDASHGVHSDYKGHTGGIITLGAGPVNVKSSKQKLNSKSSTESELIALSDYTSQIIWTTHFLQQQGYNINSPAIIYQDNTSAMSIAQSGKSTSQNTRHINIRYYFIKDRIQNGDIKLNYLPTDKMLSDILTKPLQGELFRRQRQMLLNWFD
jgi:hypothetical protein